MNEERLRQKREAIRNRSELPVVRKKAKCEYRGKQIHPSVAPGPLRNYFPCNHPKQPLGAIVCPCQGCGPSCSGYSEASPVLFNTWMYGVTTIPERRNTYLPKTLASLKAAGFVAPRLFVDGDEDVLSWKKEFNLEVTCRYPRVLTRANWMMSIVELYFRNRKANMFALFQDDCLACADLMKYIDSCKLPSEGYFNLFTMPPPHQIELPSSFGWHKSNQKGRGAVALVFTRTAIMTLLTQKHMVDNFQDAHLGDRNVDGGISDSFRKVGWTEYVHNPSLVQHIGDKTSMGSKILPTASSFTGESPL